MSNLWLPGMEESMLFIPEEIEDLLCLQTCEQATESEEEKAVLINKSTQLFLNNELDIDTYMDQLDSTGINPFFHFQRAAWIVDNVFSP